MVFPGSETPSRSPDVLIKAPRKPRVKADVLSPCSLDAPDSGIRNDRLQRPLNIDGRVEGPKGDAVAGRKRRKELSDSEDGKRKDVSGRNLKTAGAVRGSMHR